MKSEFFVSSGIPNFPWDLVWELLEEGHAVLSSPRVCNLECACCVCERRCGKVVPAIMPVNWWWRMGDLTRCFTKCVLDGASRRTEQLVTIRKDALARARWGMSLACGNYQELRTRNYLLTDWRLNTAFIRLP